MPTEGSLYVCEHCNTPYATEEQVIVCRNLPTKDFEFGLNKRVIHKMHSVPRKRRRRSSYLYQGHVVSVKRRLMATRYFSKALNRYVTGPAHVNLIRVLLDKPHGPGREQLVWFREEDFKPVTDQSTASYQKNN